MIRYALLCENDDEFEGWFGSSTDYDEQESKRLIACPACGSTAVRKAPMAPAVARTDNVTRIAAKVREHIRDNFDYVGEHFDREARAIHEGEAPERPIWGETTAEQAKALIEDGVPVAPLPAPLAPTPPRKLN